jgi:hypothetical protein
MVMTTNDAGADDGAAVVDDEYAAVDDDGAIGCPLGHPFGSRLPSARS